MAILADKFFESYDLLPREYKSMIYDSISTPTMEDLETIWKMVEETRSFNDLFREYAKKYNPEEWKKIKDNEKAEYDRKKRLEVEERNRERWDRKLKNHGLDGRWITTTVRNPDYLDPSDKNNRLVQRVAAEKALDMITKKEAKLVNVSDQYVNRTTWVPYKSREEREREARQMEINKLGFDPYAAPNKNVPKAGTNKRLGNSF